MPELPGAEFVPLEPPVTPRTPREEAASAAKSTPGQRRLSPHFEQAAEGDMLSPGPRLTPGPMREWIFRDDEVSTDTRSSTTEQTTSEAISGMNSQDEESEGNRVALCPRLNLANAMPSGAKGPASRASPSRKSPRSSLGAVGLQLRGIEVAERVCVRAQREMRCAFATACADGNCSRMCSSLVMQAGASLCVYRPYPLTRQPSSPSPTCRASFRTAATQNPRRTSRAAACLRSPPPDIPPGWMMDGRSGCAGRRACAILPEAPPPPHEQTSQV